MATYQLVDNDFRNSDLKKLSFEYVLANAFLVYTENEGISTEIEFFNKYNNFNQLKIALYPFFIATSNGHSKSLFNLFGTFIATDYGIWNTDINKIIGKKQSLFFDFESGIKIKQNDSYRTIEQFIECLKQNTVKIGNVDYNLIDLQIENDKKEVKLLIDGIESGIKVLKKQSVGAFFKFTAEDLLLKSKKYKAYNKSLTNKTDVDYNDIEQDKEDMPYYSEYYEPYKYNPAAI